MNVAGNEAAEDRNSLCPKSQNSVRDLIRTQWLDNSRPMPLTWHDIGRDDVVRRPAVVCCPAHIGSNCDSESESLTLQQSK